MASCISPKEISAEKDWEEEEAEEAEQEETENEEGKIFVTKHRGYKLWCWASTAERRIAQPQNQIDLIHKNQPLFL